MDSNKDEEIRSELERLKKQRSEAVRKWRLTNRGKVNQWASERYQRLKNEEAFIVKIRQYQQKSRLRRKQKAEQDETDA